MKSTEIAILDERSEGWYLVESPPVSISMLLIGYVVMIKFGPELMEDRKAFELQHVMMIYNFLQVLVNLVMNIFVSKVDYFSNKKLI